MREIFVKFNIKWDEYDDVCDELVLEDLELELKNGVELELVNKPVIENKEKEKWVYHTLSMLDQMSFAIDSEPGSWGETRYNADAYAVSDLCVAGYIEIKPSTKIFPLTKKMKFRFTEKALELLKTGVTL
jgi:hypothetical protein